MRSINTIPIRLLTVITFISSTLNFNRCNGQNCILINDLISLFENNNYEIKIAKNTLKKNELTLKNIFADYKFKTGFSINVPTSNSIEGIVQPDGSYNYYQRNYLNPYFEIETLKKIVATGGEIKFRNSLGFYENLRDGNRDFNSNWFSFSVSQPLFKFNEYKFQIQQAKIINRLALIKYKQKCEQIKGTFIMLAYDYQILKQNFNALELSITKANELLNNSRNLYANGRALRFDTLKAFSLLKGFEIDKLKLEEEINTTKEKLGVALGLDYKFTLCDFADICELKIDSIDLCNRYKKYLFDEPLALDSFNLANDINRANTASGINFLLIGGVGLNKSSDDLNSLFTVPSQRQNIGITFSIPITGWNSVRSKKEIALLSYNDYELARYNQVTEVKIWSNSVISSYKRLLLLIQLLKSNTESLQNMSDLMSSRIEVGKLSISDYKQFLIDLSNSQMEYFKAIKSITELRFVLREKCLYDFCLLNELE